MTFPKKFFWRFLGFFFTQKFFLGPLLSPFLKKMQKSGIKKSHQIKKGLWQKLFEILQIRSRFSFILTKSQNENSRAKTALLKGAKKHEVKKVIKSKNDGNKSWPKFYKLGDDFFLFWRNLKIMDSRAKKRFSDFAYKTRVFSPGAPKNQNFDEKNHSHAQIP